MISSSCLLVFSSSLCVLSAVCGAQESRARTDSLVFTWSGYFSGTSHVRIDRRGNVEVEGVRPRRAWIVGNRTIPVEDVERVAAAILRLPTVAIAAGATLPASECTLVATDADNITVRLVRSDTTIQVAHYTGCRNYSTEAHATRAASIREWAQWAENIAARER